jgi:hypothetical protein
MEKTYVDGIFREMTSVEYTEYTTLQEQVRQAPKPFLPIDPVPFWKATWDLLSLKKADIYAAIENPDECYLAELDIEGRKTYRRDDPTLVKLADMLGYPAQEMDALWLYVQENYR